MMPLAPVQLVDDILLNYNLGQVLLLLFVLALPAGYVLGSRRITAINLILFGVIFILVPSMDVGESYFAFLGIALLVLGPLLYTTARR